MKKLSSYILEHKFRYLIELVSMIIFVSLDMLSPQITRHIMDDVIVGGQTEKLKWLLPGILGVGVGRCIFGYIREYVSDCVGSSIASSMREDLFCHIQSLSLDFFDKTNTGELMSRVKDDIDRIWDAVGYVGMLILEVVFHTCIILVCMYSLNWKLALLPTAAMLFTGTLAILEEKRLDVIYEEISEENAKLNTVAEENLAGVRTVKAFAREKFEIAKFLSHNKRYYDLNMRQSRVFVRYYPCFNLVTKLLPLSVLLMGGWQVIKGRLTIGALSAFVEYSMNIVWPMEMLGWLSNTLSSGVGSYRKIKRLYGVAPSVREPENPVLLPAIRGGVEFRNVSFHKEDGYEILHDISFCVPPGHTIGIMGATGAGKTSVIQLLQRLYDATEGEILVDGVNIRNLSLKQLRQNISVVMQDVFLFSDTISENVKLGKREQVDYPTIHHSSACAQASGFIEKLPEKYDTVIGERGVGLSGGQKQRISIARALAKKNPILILDDSTSALDMETEAAIQQALLELKGTTRLIIAHRISAVCHADEIIVLENGCIKERGTHEQLLAQNGLYRETWQAQYGTFRDPRMQEAACMD